MKYGTGQYAPITQTAEKTDDSERLVPRDMPQPDPFTMQQDAKKQLDEFGKFYDGAIPPDEQFRSVTRWGDLAQDEQRFLFRFREAVLEAAGVERLREELESCRSVNAALYSKLEGEKELSARLRLDADGWRQVAELRGKENAVLEKALDEQKARADRAEGQRNWAADRIAALEKASRKAADAARLITYNQETQERVDNNGAFRSAMVGLRAALDSAQPAPKDTACYCSQYQSSGLPCPPGTCPNVPKSQPAPDARDERIRELESKLAKAEARVHETCKACNGLGERVEASSRYGAPSRCKECGGSGKVSAVGALKALDVVAERSLAEHTELKERIRELEAAHAAERAGYDHTMHLQADQIDQLRERIRVACAELDHVATYLNGNYGFGHSAERLSRIARELEGEDSGQPAGDATPRPRQAEEPSQAPAGCSSPISLDTLCLIAAQFETTQPQMQPLSEKLNGPERNAGPEYAIRLVERTRARLEETNG